jgi:hypothetical protein
MSEIEKLKKKLAKLERRAEKLDKNSIPFKRLMKTFCATERKIEKLS